MYDPVKDTASCGEACRTLAASVWPARCIACRVLLREPLLPRLSHVPPAWRKCALGHAHMRSTPRDHKCSTREYVQTPRRLLA